MTVVLVHGGLWEDMDAERFWVRPGVVAALAARGIPVLAPDRVPRPRSWAEEVAHLLPLLPDEPVTLVGGSNGCSVAARTAVDHPDRVGRLVLAWPATAGDSEIDTLALAAGAPPEMLAGETLRGLSDVELARLRLPVAVLPSGDQPVPPTVHSGRAAGAGRRRGRAGTEPGTAAAGVRAVPGLGRRLAGGLTGSVSGRTR
jgi:pimeloyl-ACP methyl ester carboxylesterase